jgi:hypothetical protein
MWVVLDVQPALIGGELGVARALSATVHAAAEHNLVLLENHPQTPLMYDCARKGTVRYLSESDALVASQLPLVINGKGEPIESVLSIPIIIKSNGGDCAHLSAWRLAELWRDDLQKYRQRRATCKVPLLRDHRARRRLWLPPLRSWIPAALSSFSRRG